MDEWVVVERCRKPSGFGRRHLLAILGFTGFALSYAMRFSLSIAIVAMVNTNGPAVVKVLRSENTGSDSLSTTQLPYNNNASLQRHSSVLFKSDICPHDTTPHETWDIKLHLYHVQTIPVNRSSSSSKIDNKNSFPFEVDSPSSSDTQNSSFGFANNDDRQSKHTGRHIPTSSEEPKNVDSSDNNNHHQQEAEEPGEFFWNEKEQGVILGSFFWGYVITQSLGGWLSQKFGGKWPFGIGLVITGLFSIVTPAAARLGGMSALISVRIIQGLAGGVTVPAMQAILSKWFPPEERGKLGSFTLAGMPFGTSLSTLCSGFLIYYFGWPSVFYVTGVLTLVWFIVWSCCAQATPLDDKAIGQAELHYIQAALHQPIHDKSNNAAGDYQKKTSRNLDVPWSRALLSLPFWAILICNTCETWGLYTINAELPTYMKTVLHYDIKENSILSAFPHLLTLIVSVILTNVTDYLISTKFLSIGAVRKICTSIALWGSSAALFGVAYSGCDRVKTVALLAAAVAANGGKFGGFLVNIIDIAPNYAGILMGVINTIASMPGFIAPYVAGHIINDNPSLENWRLVFLITATISFFGNLVFILFGSGEEQNWNNGSSCGSTDETLQSDDTLTLECISHVILSNNTGGAGVAVKQTNEKECSVDNGIYIIPLKSPVEAVEHRADEQPHNHGALFPAPISHTAIRNGNQDEQGHGGAEK